MSWRAAARLVARCTAPIWVRSPRSPMKKPTFRVAASSTKKPKTTFSRFTDPPAARLLPPCRHDPRSCDPARPGETVVRDRVGTSGRGRPGDRQRLEPTGEQVSTRPQLVRCDGELQVGAAGQQ